MNEKTDKKSSIKVPGDQVLDRQRKLRVEDALERTRGKTMCMITCDDLGAVDVSRLESKEKILHQIKLKVICNQ